MAKAANGSKDKNADQELSLATRAAWLSFIGGYTQGEIAKRLKVSPAKAHRLIALANQSGLVKVFVEGEPAECIALEDALMRRFDLQSCIVAPALSDDQEAEGNSEGQAALQAVAAAGARFLHQQLSDPDLAIIGVGKGRTLSAAVDRMPQIKRPDLQFAAVSGSLTRSLAANPYDVIHKLVERTGGEGYFLPVPYLASSAEEKEVLLGQPSVQALLAHAREARFFAVGIGALETDAHIRQTGMITETELLELRDQGAVGDLMGAFIDADGRPVNSAINQQSVGLSMEELRGARVVALAGGQAKARAILAALNSGIITDLIIDEATAALVVDQYLGLAA
ncbi:sugar-binding transcriptional regulator [Rhodovibrionaceae bacterium A322]